MATRHGVTALLLVLAGSLAAQRAQIGVKGRVQERGAPGPGPRNPAHILPRRVIGEIELPPNPDLVERERQRAAQPAPPPLAEDQTHLVVRRDPSLTPPAP